MKFLGQNLQDMCNSCLVETANTAFGSEDSVLLRFHFFPHWSVDSTQSKLTDTH